MSRHEISTAPDHITPKPTGCVHAMAEYLQSVTFANGCIAVTGPDEELIRNLRDIAGRLGTKVQGEDGEPY